MTDAQTRGLPINPDFWGLNGFHNVQGGTTIGSARRGFFMEARWDVDNDQWIGPACEIEGACSTLEAPSNFHLAEFLPGE